MPGIRLEKAEAELMVGRQQMTQPPGDGSGKPIAIAINLVEQELSAIHRGLGKINDSSSKAEMKAAIVEALIASKNSLHTVGNLQKVIATAWPALPDDQVPDEDS